MEASYIGVTGYAIRIGDHLNLLSFPEVKGRVGKILLRSFL
jgi:hypothetical protein